MKIFTDEHENRLRTSTNVCNNSTIVNVRTIIVQEY